MLVHNYDFALPSKGWEMGFEENFNLCPLQCPMKVKKRRAMEGSRPLHRRSIVTLSYVLGNKKGEGGA